MRAGFVPSPQREKYILDKTFKVIMLQHEIFDLLSISEFGFVKTKALNLQFQI